MGKVAGHKKNCYCPACQDPKKTLNLRVSKEIDDLLAQVIEITGKSKTGVISEILGKVLPKIIKKKDG